MRPRISLGYASRERPWRAGLPSYDFHSCCNSIAGKGMRIVDETRPRDLKGGVEFRHQARPAAQLEQAAPRGGRASPDVLSSECAEQACLRRHPLPVVEDDG